MKVKVTDKDAGTSEKEITVNIIDVKDNIEINKEDIVDGKVKEDKIDKTKVIEGLKEEDKDRVKVEITVNEENGKGKVTKDKDGNTIKKRLQKVKDDQGSKDDQNGKDGQDGKDG